MISTWTVYIARCRDGSLYTGVTTDPVRRLAEHNSGGGAAYTRSRAPVVLVYLEVAIDRSQAQSRERAIKRLSRAQKEELVRRRAPHSCARC
jgi:putative endonuclease